MGIMVIFPNAGSNGRLGFMCYVDRGTSLENKSENCS